MYFIAEFRLRGIHLKNSGCILVFLGSLFFWNSLNQKQEIFMTKGYYPVRTQGYTAQTLDDIRQNLAEQLVPNFAQRNDEAVAPALYAGEPIDAAHTVGEVELLSGFFDFLQETGIMTPWQTFTIEGVKRGFLPAIYFVLLYSARVWFAAYRLFPLAPDV